MRFSIAVNSQSRPNVPVPLSGVITEQIEFAASLGYDGVEIHVPSCKNLPVKKILRICDAKNMSIDTLGTGSILGKFGLSLVDEDTDRQNLLFEMLKDYIDTARQLRSRVTIGSIKGNVRSGESFPEKYTLLGKHMQRIDQYAASQGVTLLLEATNRYENNILNKGKEVCSFIIENGLQNTRILLDVFHMNIEESDIRKCLEENIDFVDHIHVADNNRRYPGAGAYPFDLFAGWLRQCGYDKVISLECLPWPDMKTAALNSILYLKQKFGAC